MHENNFLDDLQRQHDLNLTEVEPEPVKEEIKAKRNHMCDLFTNEKPPAFNKKVHEFAWKDGVTGEIHPNIHTALGRQGDTLVRKANSNDAWAPYDKWEHGEFIGSGEWIPDKVYKDKGRYDYSHILVFNDHAPEDPKTFEIGRWLFGGRTRSAYPCPTWPREGVIPTDNEVLDYEDQKRQVSHAERHFWLYLNFLRWIKPRIDERREENDPTHSDWTWINSSETEAKESLAWLKGAWTTKGIRVPTDAELLKLALEDPPGQV